MKLQYKPKVSIIIPVFNGENYLRQAIASALGQTYPYREVLVVDDGSEDCTEKIAKSYGDEIRYLKKSNGGVASALNLGIEKMTGEWFSWLSHDDLYYPNKIWSQIQVLNKAKNENSDFTKMIPCCQNNRIDADGRIMFFKSKHNMRNFEEYAGPLGELMKQLHSYTIGGCNVLISRKAFHEVGLFREDIPTVADAEMWYRLMLSGYHFLYSNDILVQSRRHPNQVSAKKEKIYAQEKKQLYNELVEYILGQKIQEDRLWELGKCLLLNSHRDAAYMVFHALEEKRGRKFDFLKKISIDYINCRSLLLEDMKKAYRRATWRR